MQENEETTGVAMPQEEVSVVSQSPVERDYTKEQHERCMPVAIEMMKIMIGNGILPENMLSTREEKDAMYFEMMQKMYPVLMEGGVDFEGDIEHISKMIGSSLYMLTEVIKDSLNRNLDELRNNLFDEDDKTDNVLTVRRLSDLSVRRQKIREAVKLILAEPFVPEVK